MSGGYREKVKGLLNLEGEVQIELEQARRDIQNYANLEPGPNDSEVLKETKEAIRMIMDDSFLKLRNEVRDKLLQGKEEN